MTSMILISPQELEVLIQNAVNKAIDAKQQLPVLPSKAQEVQNLLTRQNLLSILKCSSTTLWALTKNNKIPYMRLGKRLYYDLN
jgi:hypothetical protein